RRSAFALFDITVYIADRASQQPVRLRADLMRRAVVDPERRRPAPYVHAQRFPRKRLLENSLPEIAREKQTVRAILPQRRQKPKLRDAHVLRFIHHREIERRRTAARKLRGQLPEKRRFGNEALGSERGSYARKHLPKRRARRFGQSRFPA